MHKMKRNDIICYFTQDWDTRFILSGIAFEHETDKIYVNNVFPTSYINDNTSYCKINDFLTEKLTKIINTQLEAYVKARLNRYDFYKNLNEGFCKELLNHLINNNMNPIIRFNDVELYNGIMTVFVGFETYEYDLRINRLFPVNIPLFWSCYGDKLNLIIAQEQLRLGIAPKALTEVYKLKMALDNRKSVGFVFKDGETITMSSYKNGDVIKDIFNFMIEDSKIYCSFTSYHRFNYREIEELDYLKLDNDKYYISFENFNEPLCKPTPLSGMFNVS